MPLGIVHRRMPDADTPKELLYGIDAIGGSQGPCRFAHV